VNSIADDFDEPLDSPGHAAIRDTMWMAYYYFEVMYFLGIAIGVNEFRRSREEVLIHYREFVLKNWPASQVFLKSVYWEEYFLVLLRQFYRDSANGKLYPIRNESKPDRALRTLVSNPSIRQPQLAQVLKTTEKQLLRMSMLQLAFRELSQNFEQPDIPKKQRKR
jgi:hypothetical protein